jgi:hypothetical protein
MALTPGALTTVTQVKLLDTGKDAIPANHDTLLEFLIEALSDLMERYCGRSFEKKTYSEKYVGRGGQRLMIKNRPIVTVASVTVDGTAIASTEYEVESQAGFLFRESGWHGGLKELPIIPLGDPHPTAIRFNIVVGYDAGYITPNMTGTRDLPYDLELICVRLVLLDYKLRDKQGLSQMTHESLAMSFDRWPEDIKVALDLYKDVA